MKRTILIFGLILGILLCGNIVYTTNLMYTNPNFKGNDFLGYAAMVLVFSLTFFGIRNYRNNVLGGAISFGKAFQTGALIAFTGATMYVVFWLFYYYLVVPDFLDVYIAYVLKETPAPELAAKTREMNDFKGLYSNTFFVVLVTYMEVLPVGLLVALVSSLVLKKKPL
jgi:hypothetical protein